MHQEGAKRVPFQESKVFSPAQERLVQEEQEIIDTKNLLRELNLKTVSHFETLMLCATTLGCFMKPSFRLCETRPWLDLR